MSNTMGGDTPRRDNDAYNTPASLARACARRVKEVLGEFPVVVEPSAGTGAFTRAAREVWPGAAIIAVEPSGYLVENPGSDAWLQSTWEAFDHDLTGEKVLIIGNPPFVLAEEHIRLALERLDDGSALAFLLRASILAGKDRVAGLWRDWPPANVWHLAPRPSFTGDGKTDGAEYVLIAWVKGQRTPFAGGWLEWSKDRP